MQRKLFTAASAVSLLFCLAVLVLWARSTSVRDEWLTEEGATRADLLTSLDGRIFQVRVRLDRDTRIYGILQHDAAEKVVQREEHAARTMARRQVDEADPAWIGVSDSWHEHCEVPGQGPLNAEEWRTRWISDNLIAAFAAILPASWLVRWWKDRKRREP